MSSGITSVIKEFSWCENADQKVGAMASEISYLRMHVKALQEKLEQKLQGQYKEAKREALELHLLELLRVTTI